MTDTTLGSTRSQAPTSLGPARFSRIAGIAGLVTVAVGALAAAFVGTTPGVGDSAREVAAYFADNTASLRPAVADIMIAP